MRNTRRVPFANRSSYIKMQILLRFLLVAGLAYVPASSAADKAAAKTPSQLIPDRAALSLEILKPGPVFDALLNTAFENRLKALPGYEGLVAGPKLRDLRNVARLLETTLHTNWQSTVRTVIRQ